MTTKPNFGTLIKRVHHFTSTKPHMHNIIHEILINKSFTMACPNLLKNLERDFGISRDFFIAWKLTFII
jgi:hypothetical protein